MATGQVESLAQGIMALPKPNPLKHIDSPNCIQPTSKEIPKRRFKKKGKRMRKQRQQQRAIRVKEIVTWKTFLRSNPQSQCLQATEREKRIGGSTSQRKKGVNGKGQKEMAKASSLSDFIVGGSSALKTCT